MNLKIFAETNLFNAGTSFFKQLNIRLNSSSTSSLPLKSILKDKFKSQEIFEKISAAYFLGLVDKSVFDDNLSLFEDKKLSYEQAEQRIHADYEGMMIFAVQIDGIDSPTRTQLSDLTRAFNRASKSLPVVCAVPIWQLYNPCYLKAYKIQTNLARRRENRQDFPDQRY